jgi:hypothetical protein
MVLVHFGHLLLLEFVHGFHSFYGGTIGIAPLNIKIEMASISSAPL